MTNSDSTVALMRMGTIEVPIPKYQTEGAAGLDLCAAISAPIVIAPGERVKVPTGLAFAIPTSMEGQVRPRSGLAAQRGLTVLNSPGTIDSDYRGEVQVLLINLGTEPATLAPLERMAQLVFAAIARPVLTLTHSLPETARGDRGYGSTGT